ncbi:repeat-containing 74-like [Octopus vulgaris]|uniref:Repeat-containing 74-like n=2 Tax=Octopus vulgaris TaxID=6645 RepID=A0AA36AYZ3_OCTVU|nr:repeat-containing 74-like [Octopus vulgaris]
MAEPVYSIFVGAEIGLLKGANCEERAWGNLNELNEVKRENEITCMCWLNRKQTKFYYGQQNNIITTFDVEASKISRQVKMNIGEGKFKNIHPYQKKILTAVSSGDIKLWTKKGKNVLKMSGGVDLACVQQDPVQTHLIASGGNENPLKLWDINSPTSPIFVSKNVSEDWLRLRVPIMISTINFIPQSSKIVTGTDLCKIRLYDPSANKRKPVLDVQCGDSPVTALAVNPSGNQIIVGSSKGDMVSMDIRKGKITGKFKGFSGGIRGIQCHPTLPYVATCGLDRYLRVYNLVSREMIYSFYLKSRLNCLLFAKKWPSAGESASSCPNNENSTVDQNEDENAPDDLWDKMPVLQTESTTETPSGNAKKKRKSNNESKSSKKNKTSE